MADPPSKADITEEELQVPGSVQEMPEPSGPPLPRNAQYLALAEVFIAFAVLLNNRALMVDLFGLGPENTVMLNFAMGTIYATILTVLAIQWTAIVTCVASTFHILLLAWMLMPNATCQTCAYLAPALSMFSATLEPIRLAFLSDQLTTAKPSYVRPYFTFIAGSWFMGYAIVQFVTFHLGGTSMVPAVCTTIATIFILYSALVVYIEVKTKEDRAKYCPKVRFAAKEMYWKHEGKKYWAMFHIGITLTGHFAARLIINMAQKEQLRSIQYTEKIPGIGQSVMVALPAILAVVIIIIMGFGVTPLLKRFNKEITDLQFMGLGMVLGCIAMIMTMSIQSHIDGELKPPRRQECLLFLYNLLPSNTEFRSKVFGKSDMAFIQLTGTSSTAFISRNVVDVDEYPISVINLKEKMQNETFIELLEGRTVSYVVTRDQFQNVSGLDLHTHHFLGQESTVFIGCALDTKCEGKKISFLHKGTIHEVELPPKHKFLDVHLLDGKYTINAFVDNETMTLTENFTTKSKNIHTAIVYDKEPGVPDIAIFLTSEPQKIPLGLYISQQIMIAFREGFFTVGLFRFLYYQTPPNSPARPFVYSTFFFIYKGVPYIVTGGLRTSIFNFLERFIVQVYLAYYACCTVLFINLANKYEHMKWKYDDDEND